MGGGGCGGGVGGGGGVDLWMTHLPRDEGVSSAKGFCRIS